ncbi:UDP-N-acetylglucosamine-N-acetylmuramyl-(pentapeptide) pyrophosphoryl-undecaprenol N-acetylglucosamine transferase [Propionispora sp. 2/2-37]|uniref:undecaprenyldiphospho-muramoylpentapeptide beta-N-acetylglucosaminyltransferase n=1 Tax=Propionispora sp. 2/2-37 TaxID=1677858 RepID=UPI0006BB80FC|nr:undecaprenyldiphospho-muramoylpentapeptide beta-N-acetylglucosaminyltransferase [Propionispora sp. 2/2-37]CUH94036.1 UDP-N-acetylglucosamine-N-acetylmuramyl-(pentapeptide) pyrophosphoryl-undecaprenol N-acetylglucosamine transferase [Propionispora sp. 2/2-37]
MRIIISGGGTGGHIYPAVTIAREMQKLFDSSDILFVGTRNSMEADIIPKEGFKLETIQVKGFDRKFSWGNISNLFNTIGSVWSSRKILKRFKPDIVIGTGGYVCGPILFAASLMGIPSMIQEQNVIPGVTNKILARFVDKIAVGYLESAKYFGSSNQHKVIFSGNPIRQDVLSVTREDAMISLNLDPDKRTILISGGSRGARSINKAMIEVHRYFQNCDDIQLLHVTGQNEYNNVVGKLKQYGIDEKLKGNIIIKPYLYNMPQALAVADLAIFRAGAIGLAELTAKGIPAILIPYPYAAANHQAYNARVMEQNGAAVVVDDHELCGDKLAGIVEKIIRNPDILQTMAEASRNLGKPDAANLIAREAAKLVGK